MAKKAIKDPFTGESFPEPEPMPEGEDKSVEEVAAGKDAKPAKSDGLLHAERALRAAEKAAAKVAAGDSDAVQRARDVVNAEQAWQDKKNAMTPARQPVMIPAVVQPMQPVEHEPEPISAAQWHSENPGQPIEGLPAPAADIVGQPVVPASEVPSRLEPQIVEPGADVTPSEAVADQPAPEPASPTPVQPEAWKDEPPVGQ